MDADALIHIIDASGGTDEGGNQAPGDPLRDIKWVYSELHRWIFGNVWAKSGMKQISSERFASLFTGYSAVADDVFEAMQRSGVNIEEWHLEKLDRSTIHTIVAHFLRIRFPVLLAANKNDDPRSEENIARIREAFPFERCVSLSALHNRGVREALNEAVSLRSPLYVYNLKPGRLLRSGHPVASSETVCRLFRPQSTFFDCYDYWHHHSGDESLALPGELMRAEFVAQDGSRRVAKKSDLLLSETVVILMTNKKRQSWQQHLLKRQQESTETEKGRP